MAGYAKRIEGLAQVVRYIRYGSIPHHERMYPVIEYFQARQIGSCDVDVMIAITSVMALCVSG